MDPGLLSKLPDNAKLSILRHLGATVSKQHQPAEQGTDLRLQHDSPAAAAGSVCEAATLLAGRRLEGGLAIVDGFLDVSDIQAARQEARAVLQEQARVPSMVAASGGGGCAAGPGSDGRAWSDRSTRGDQAAWLDCTALEAAGRRCLAAAVRALLSLRTWLARQGLDVGGQPSVQLACYPGGGTRYVRHRDASSSVPNRTVTAILYLNTGWEPSHGGALCVYSHSTVGTDPCAASAADLGLLVGDVAAGASGRTDAADVQDFQDLDASAAEQAWQQQQAHGKQSGEQGGQQALSGRRSIRSGLDDGHPATVVPPVGGRLVVMDSRLLHEVLPSDAERWAVTVWFSKAPAHPPDEQPQVSTAADSVAEAGTHGQAAGQAWAAAQEFQHQQPAEQQVAQAQHARAASAPLQQQAQQQTHQQQSVCPGPPAALSANLGAAGTAPPGTIFVSIPAYRDSEAQWTMADLFAKAERPERVRVGIVWQVELPEDASFVRLAGDQRWLAQVRQVLLPASEATGPCKARALAQRLWEAEEFHLQIDSHMRFVPGWDAALLRMLRQAEAAAGHSRVVLSSYPPGYEGEGPGASLPAEPLPTVLCASRWGERDGLLRITGRKLKRPLAAPAPALFWAAGLSFSRAQLIREVPYPRDLTGLFFGEEALQLQRMWCAGWDVYAPPQAVAFHLWSRKHRPTFRQESLWHQEQREASQRRVAAALAGLDEGSCGGSTVCNDSKGGAAPEPAESLGRAARVQPWQRSLQQFWEHTGVDFRSKAICERARNGGFPAEAFLGADLQA